MFTGLVEETGKVLSIDEKADGKRIKIQAKETLENIAEGSSIAVNGVCLTVEDFSENEFTIFAVPETLKLTNIGYLKVDDLVNLERAMKANDRLGGHIVQGHVENMADVSGVEKFDNHWDITIAYSSEYAIPKGSIAIDGISLTIHELGKNSIKFQIIPETLKKTNIPKWFAGYKVNIETDYLVKALDHIIRYRAENAGSP